MNLRKTRRKRYWQKRNMRECGKLFQRHSHKLHSTGTCKYTANREIRGKDERQLHTVRGLQIQTWYLKVLVKGELFPFRALFAIAVVVIILLCNSSLVCDAQGAAFLEIIIIESFSVASPRELMTIENWDVWEWQTKMPAVLNENETKLL